jgi:hypothetical protein
VCASSNQTWTLNLIGSSFNYYVDSQSILILHWLFQCIFPFLVVQVVSTEVSVSRAQQGKIRLEFSHYFIRSSRSPRDSGHIVHWLPMLRLPVLLDLTAEPV